MKYVVHIGADQINERGIYGAFLHYAVLADAAARHKYVESRAAYISSSITPRDYLGNRYERIGETHAP